jgi:hypothetical protein
MYVLYANFQIYFLIYPFICHWAVIYDCYTVKYSLCAKLNTLTEVNIYNI